MEQPYLVWTILAGMLLAGEMFSGTFYLLIVALAFALAALLAWLGIPFALQLLVAAGVGVAGVGWLWRQRRQTAPAAGQDNFDIGQTVTIVSWHDATRVRVRHRGTEWDARLVRGSRESTPLYIVAVQASTLLLSDQPPEKSQPSCQSH
ncbi:MAG: NfeD family protein [Chitinivorax sp.]